MRLRESYAAVLSVWVTSVPHLLAEDLKPDLEAWRNAIRRSIPLLEKGAAGSAHQRKCFTCHNQAVPILALIEARNRGFAIDEVNLDRQLRHTAQHLQRGRQNYLKGHGQGGKVITAGYALWALQAGSWKADDTTAAVTNFLLTYQKQANHWRHPGNRPPSSGSDSTASYVALRGLASFGTDQQRPQIKARTRTVTEWLLSKKPLDTEDRVFRLRALRYADPIAKSAVRQATEKLLGTQRADGGWAQISEMQSDAYATSTVLVALLRDGTLSSTHPAVERGLKLLVDTQQEDGSWHVVSRAKPFQTYFESGFPHGKDQFISLSASSWATLALLLSLPAGQLD